MQEVKQERRKNLRSDSVVGLEFLEGVVLISNCDEVQYYSTCASLRLFAAY